MMDTLFKLVTVINLAIVATEFSGILMTFDFNEIMVIIM